MAQPERGDNTTMTDNECYLEAKRQLFPNIPLSELTTAQFSSVIHRAQQIKMELPLPENLRRSPRTYGRVTDEQ
jgi:hypothetical protein